MPSQNDTAGAGSSSRGEVTSYHVRKAIRGDMQSLDWLVAHLTPLLESQAVYRLGPHLSRVMDPRDLVQEVWMVALSRLPALRPRSGRYAPVFMKFISSTLVKKANHVLRSYWRDRNGHSAIADAAIGADAFTSGVVREACRRDECQRVRSAINMLSVPDRTVLILRGLEQLPNKVAARILGESPNTVTVRYKRALARLRKALPESVADEMPD